MFINSIVGKLWSLGIWIQFFTKGELKKERKQWACTIFTEKLGPDGGIDGGESECDGREGAQKKLLFPEI